MEFNVDKQIKSYWNKFISRPMQILKSLQVQPLGTVFEHKMSGRIRYYTKEARHLETHPDEALELDFNIDPDVNVIVPD